MNTDLYCSVCLHTYAEHSRLSERKACAVYRCGCAAFSPLTSIHRYRLELILWAIVIVPLLYAYCGKPAKEPFLHMLAHGCGQ